MINLTSIFFKRVAQPPTSHIDPLEMRTSGSQWEDGKQMEIFRRILSSRPKQHDDPVRWTRTIDTVDGRNLTPPGVYKTSEIVGNSIYQLVEDSFHQQL